jgi:hypothetical protein
MAPVFFFVSKIKKIDKKTEEELNNKTTNARNSKIKAQRIL